MQNATFKENFSKCKKTNPNEQFTLQKYYGMFRLTCHIIYIITNKWLIGKNVWQNR